MSTKAKTVQDVPSITNSGLKVAPYSNTSRFMELHKLDYKRNNLLNKLEKSERDIRNVKRNLEAVERDILEMMGKIDLEVTNEGKQIKNETAAQQKKQLLKY